MAYHIPPITKVSFAQGAAAHPMYVSLPHRAAPQPAHCCEFSMSVVCMPRGPPGEKRICLRISKLRLGKWRKDPLFLLLDLWFMRVWSYGTGFVGTAWMHSVFHVGSKSAVLCLRTPPQSLLVGQYRQSGNMTTLYTQNNNNNKGPPINPVTYWPSTFFKIKLD